MRGGVGEAYGEDAAMQGRFDAIFWAFVIGGFLWLSHRWGLQLRAQFGIRDAIPKLQDDLVNGHSLQYRITLWFERKPAFRLPTFKPWQEISA